MKPKSKLCVGRDWPSTGGFLIGATIFGVWDAELRGTFAIRNLPAGFPDRATSGRCRSRTKIFHCVYDMKEKGPQDTPHHASPPASFDGSVGTLEKTRAWEWKRIPGRRTTKPIYDGR